MQVIETIECFNNFDFKLTIVEPETLNHNVSVVYIHGMGGNPYQKKPEQIKNISIDAGVRFCSYELSGHANSLELYDNAGIYDWVDQLEYLVTNRIKGKILLMGSCLGGIIGLLVGEKYSDRFLGVVGIGTANVNWYRHVNQQQLSELQTQGYTYKNLGAYSIPCRISRKFMLSTQEYDKKELFDVSFPVHLMYGLADDIASQDELFALNAKIKSPEKVIKLVDKAVHRMTDKVSYNEMKNSIFSMLAKI